MINLFMDPSLSPPEQTLLDDWWDSDRPDGYADNAAAAAAAAADTSPAGTLSSMIHAKSSHRTQNQQSQNQTKGSLLWQSYELPLPAVLQESQR